MSIISTQSDIAEVQCAHCTLIKPAKDFYFDKRRGRVGYVCRVCSGRKERIKRANSPQYLAYRRSIACASHKKHRDGLTTKYRVYRRGATKRGLVFALTLAEFTTFWQKPCVYCGTTISTVGIDRVDSTKGYLLANCVPCCFSCNNMKNNITLSMCRKILQIAEAACL